MCDNVATAYVKSEQKGLPMMYTHRPTLEDYTKYLVKEGIPAGIEADKIPQMAQELLAIGDGWDFAYVTQDEVHDSITTLRSLPAMGEERTIGVKLFEMDKWLMVKATDPVTYILRQNGIDTLTTTNQAEAIEAYNAASPRSYLYDRPDLVDIGMRNWHKAQELHTQK